MTPAWMVPPIKTVAMNRLLATGAGLAFVSLVACGTWQEKGMAKYVCTTIALAGWITGGAEALRQWRVLQDPARADAIEYLAKLGPLDELAGRIEAELKAPGALRSLTRTSFLPAKQALLSKNWLVIDGPFEYAILQLDDLVWAHLKETTRKMHGVTGEVAEAVMFYFANENEREVEVKSGTGAEVLQKAVEGRPWVILGFHEEFASLWKADRAAFIARVKARRTQQGT